MNATLLKGKKPREQSEGYFFWADYFYKYSSVLHISSLEHTLPPYGNFILYMTTRNSSLLLTSKRQSVSRELVDQGLSL